MLVLTRKAGESIVVGDDIVVTVLEIRGGQVRLGVEAPRDISVHRSEVQHQVVSERNGPAED
jgi:carbon storage regulator